MANVIKAAGGAEAICVRVDGLQSDDSFSVIVGPVCYAVFCEGIAWIEATRINEADYKEDVSAEEIIAAVGEKEFLNKASMRCSILKKPQIQ